MRDSNYMKYSKQEIIDMLSIIEPSELEQLRIKAYNTMMDNCGSKVYLRGLVEFSNYCINDCNYCGIRKSNIQISRYILNKEDIIKSAMWSINQGYGSVVLQSGERKDDAFIDFVCDVVSEIKAKSKSDELPNGAGITLSIGEQSQQNYEKLFAAGAHRYLLRIETSNPKLYSQIHPKEMVFENRIYCLRSLQEIGFQTGTGVMIGIPGQTIADLADDVLFFKAMDIDMIGMGPFIPHHQTPMNDEIFPWDKMRNYQLALNMIAVCRIVMPDINIASTTALQAICDGGRENGLMYGANVIMPQQTPVDVRREYQLYEGKPFLSESLESIADGVNMKIENIGRQIAINEFGDSKHYFKKKRQ